MKLIYILSLLLFTLPPECEQPGTNIQLKGRVWVVEQTHEADIIVFFDTYPRDNDFTVTIFESERPNPDCGEWVIVNMFDNHNPPTHDFKIAVTNTAYAADLMVRLDPNHLPSRRFMRQFDISW